MNNPDLYAGIMSGTSLDGIDAVLVEFPEGKPKLAGTHYLPYGQQLKDALLALHQPADNELHHAQLIGNELARLYAAAVAALLKKYKLAPDRVRAIGCHGQTVRHRPERGYTLQLGNAALLAELSGITVVSDFRSRDIAAGGQGAPLVPAFHGRIFSHPGIHRVIVNIGGISNLTDLPGAGDISGFDCGPGNLLMDAWCMQHLGKPFDDGGTWAATGRVLPSLLARLLEEPFFAMPPPKSSGRDLFSMEWLQNRLQGGGAPADVQATLLELTCHAIAQAIRQYCAGAEEVYLCGGGAHNHALLKRLEQLLPDCRIQPTDVLGISADWIEAAAFAWLARQALNGEPSSMPAVTGARHACVLGAIYQA